MRLDQVKTQVITVVRASYGAYISSTEEKIPLPCKQASKQASILCLDSTILMPVIWQPYGLILLAAGIWLKPPPDRAAAKHPRRSSSQN